MAPKRPPPLPKSLFVNGPLAPGTAPLAPSPSTLHPTSVIDAAPAAGLSQGVYAGTKLAGIIGSSSVDQANQSDVQVFDAIKTIPFDAQKHKDHAKAASDLANQDVVRIDIEQLAPFITESEWDALEELVHQLSKPNGDSVKNEGTTGLEGMMAKIGEPETQLGLHVQESRKRVIMIAGLLPPPIAPHLPSQQLLSAQLYQTYVNHLTSLSLNENVHLLLVAPVLSNAQPANAKPVGTWWTDEGEIERVIRMYVSTALECFGTHRIVFGTANPVMNKRSTGEEQIISDDKWYSSIARPVVAELVAGEGVQEAQLAMDAIFAGNARRILSGL